MRLHADVGGCLKSAHEALAREHWADAVEWLAAAAVLDIQTHHQTFLAGAFEAAHCRGRNATSYGVLFLNGTNDPCTDAQVASFRWLIDVLKWVQAIAPRAAIVQHGKVAATVDGPSTVPCTTNALSLP
jgi:N-acetyl-anhydromuramyl-L-alanine amidase AmpD